MAVALNKVPVDHAFLAPNFARAFEVGLSLATTPNSCAGNFLLGSTGLRSVELGEKPLDVERLSDHRKLALPRMGPLLARTVPGELDAVLVRVAEVEGLGDAVVGGAVYGIP